MTTTETERKQAEMQRLLNVRRNQTGSRAAATQRKIDDLYREIAAAERAVRS